MHALRGALVALLTGALLGGCTRVASPVAPGDSPPARHSYTVPRVLRYATASDITGLNPFFSDELVVSYMTELTMAWLVRYDRHNRPIPELATVIPTQANGGISADGKTITYHLRRNATWSDGAPFTADDVVFSIGAVLNPANNVISREGWDHISSVAEPDKYTVVLRLKKPYSPFLGTFFSTGGANPCILPKHLLGGLPDINHAAYNSLPVGIGPFKFVRWKRGDFVEMEANPRYFRGRPKLDRVIFRIIPDANTTLIALQSHAIDLWLPVRVNFYDRVRAIPGVTVFHQSSYFYNHIDFNLSHPIVDDPKVRQALRYATDRATILAKLFHGLGVLQESPISPAHPAYVRGIARVPFDLAKANAIFDADGWTRGPDGIRGKAGRRLSLDYASFTGAPDIDARIELIRQSWRAAGVDIRVHRYLPSTMFETYQNGGIIYAGKFDVTNFAWGATPAFNLANTYGCGRVPPNGQNDLHYCNPAVQRDIAAMAAIYDPARRQPYVDDAIRRIAADVPSIVVDVNEDLYAYNSDLRGFHPNQLSPFDDMMGVDI